MQNKELNKETNREEGDYDKTKECKQAGSKKIPHDFWPRSNGLRRDDLRVFHCHSLESWPTIGIDLRRISPDPCHAK